jgi:hypothetical protein
MRSGHSGGYQTDFARGAAGAAATVDEGLLASAKTLAVESTAPGTTPTNSTNLIEIQMRGKAIGLVLSALGFAACNLDTGPTFIPSTLNGPFALQVVNGASLPAAVFDSASPPLRVDALNGVITIKPDNTFSDVTTFRQTLRGVITTRAVTCVGTYTAVGNVFQFVETGSLPDCGLTFTGVVSGTSMTASVLGVPAVYGQ